MNYPTFTYDKQTKTATAHFARRKVEVHEVPKPFGNELRRLESRKGNAAPGLYFQNVIQRRVWE